ncbi:uncharacterized protein TNCV_2953671 [Trichonephila clavipes]|nr:uncharacterized protein TNCV_2953671 [Trichonephila clavipes]
MVWGGIGFHCCNLLVHITGTLTSLKSWSQWLSETFSACHKLYSNRKMHDHTWHAILKSSSSTIRLNCFLRWLVFPICHHSKMSDPCLCNGMCRCVPGTTCVCVRDTPPAASPDQLWQYVEAAWTAVPQGYTQSLFDSIPKRVAVVTASNFGYTNYRFCHHRHVTRPVI